MFTEPTTLFDDGISDHSPFIVTFVKRSGLANDSQPIDPAVIRTKVFDKFFKEVHGAIDEPDSIPPRRLQLLNTAIRYAAKYARNALHHINDDKTNGRLELLLTIAKCGWHHNVKLATALLDRSLVAADYIRIENGSIVFLDADSFAAELASLREKALKGRTFALKRNSSETIDMSNPMKTNIHRAKIKVLQCKAKLWNPVNRRHLVSGIILDNGTTVTDPGEIAEAYADGWASTFQFKKTDIHKAKGIAHGHCTRMDCRDINLPPAQAFVSFWRRAAHSTTGTMGYRMQDTRGRHRLQLPFSPRSCLDC